MAGNNGGRRQWVQKLRIPPGSYERTDDQGFYILEVTRESRINSVRGRILVDGQDFAVARMEGEPAKTLVVDEAKCHPRHYEKIGEFWLPARNETNTQVRIVGHSC